MFVAPNDYVFLGTSSHGIFRSSQRTTSVAASQSTVGSYSLHQNYPNPFNPSTAIEYDVSKECYVTLKIYNTLGNELATLVASTLSPGRYRATWNASGVSTGVYFCRMQAGEFIAAKKLILVK